MTQSLEERVSRLESIEAIKQLKARYCAYCDKAYDPAGITSLFVPDGVWDGGRFGRYVGHREIAAYFAKMSDLVTFSAHLITNPIISIDGDRATGQWWILTPATRIRAGKKEAYWMMAEYDDVYVRVDGQWLYETLKADLKFVAPHSEGWAEQAG